MVPGKEWPLEGCWHDAGESDPLRTCGLGLWCPSLFLSFHTRKLGGRRVPRVPGCPASGLTFCSNCSGTLGQVHFTGYTSGQNSPVTHCEAQETATAAARVSVWHVLVWGKWWDLGWRSHRDAHFWPWKAACRARAGRNLAAHRPGQSPALRGPWDDWTSPGPTFISSLEGAAQMPQGASASFPGAIPPRESPVSAPVYRPLPFPVLGPKSLPVLFIVGTRVRRKQTT